MTSFLCIVLIDTNLINPDPFEAPTISSTCLSHSYKAVKILSHAERTLFVSVSYRDLMCS